MFASDRDLLVHEPALFRDVVIESQRVVKGLGTITSGTLAMEVSDITFEDAGVEKGWVVTVGNASLEVLELYSAGEARGDQVSWYLNRRSCTGQNAPCRPAHIASSAAGAAFAWRGSGKFTNTHRIFPVLM